MADRRLYRILFASGIVVALLTLGAGYVTSSVGETTTAIEQRISTGEGSQVVAPRDGITVVATDSNAWLGRDGDSPRALAELVAFAPDGSVLYYDDSHTRYWDVDPVPGTEATVEYVYADHRNESECGGEAVCTVNGVERVNLTTGEVTDVYSRITPSKHSTRWHDVDRIDETHLAVADIAQDRVFVVDLETGLVTWEWDAQTDFSVTNSGGPYPEDWTHVNDVEVLDDGRLMVSLRNHDQVVFLDRETGLQEDWTLGSDGDHATLYEQHNPDYVPSGDGGPAAIVADSENSRVVEYQRDGNAWRRTWAWRDARLQWPRDADRLPNGNTLITDSNGNRVLEVNPQGEVVWSADVAFPYEAERLGTGDESADGPSATAAGLESRTETGHDRTGDGSPDSVGEFFLGVKSAFAPPQLNAVMYVLPAWMGVVELLACVLLGASSVGWGVAEWRWTRWTANLRSPVRFERER